MPAAERVVAGSGGPGDLPRALAVLGPPGAGKGTQAARLAAGLGLATLSTGELLRDHAARGTALGREVGPVLRRGELVPDALVLALVREELARLPRPRVVFDGFPRTLHQAVGLDELLRERGIGLEVAVLLEVPAAELVARLARRAERERRADDAAETLRRRLAVYQAETDPVARAYERRGVLRRVDGVGTPDEVHERVCRALG